MCFAFVSHSIRPSAWATRIAMQRSHTHTQMFIKRAKINKNKNKYIRKQCANARDPARNRKFTHLFYFSQFILLFVGIITFAFVFFLYVANFASPCLRTRTHTHLGDVPCRCGSGCHSFTQRPNLTPHSGVAIRTMLACVYLEEKKKV